MSTVCIELLSVAGDGSVTVFAVRRLGRLACAITCAVLIGGCTQQIAGKGQLTGVMTLPEEPKVIHENSAKGAVTAARYWAELLNFSMTTGNNKKFLQMGLPKCISCQRFAENIGHIYRSGNHLLGGSLIFRGSTVDSLEKDAAVIRVLFESPGFTRISPDGKVSVYSKKEERTFQFKLSWINGQWKVAAASDVTG